MSRNRALLTLSAILIIQTPIFAKSSSHHGTSKSRASAGFRQRATRSLSNADKTPAVINQEGKPAPAGTTIVRTESRLIPHDMDAVSAPDGALYTTSDDCA